jgi:hypothetical protein
VTLTEAFEQESYLRLANRQLGNTSDAEDQRLQEETLQQVSIFNAVFLPGLVDRLAPFRGKSMPIPLFGDTTTNASDDEDGETILPASSASSGTSGELVTTDDNPF